MPSPRRSKSAVQKRPLPVETGAVIQSKVVPLKGRLRALYLGGSYEELIADVKSAVVKKGERVQSIRMVFRAPRKGKRNKSGAKYRIQKRNIGTGEHRWDVYLSQLLEDRAAENLPLYGFALRVVKTNVSRDPKTGRFVEKPKQAPKKPVKPARRTKKK